MPFGQTRWNELAAQYLKYRRLQMGLTQAAFAAELSTLLGLDILPDSLAKYERGVQAISAAVLLAAQSLPRRRARKLAA